MRIGIRAALAATVAVGVVVVPAADAAKQTGAVARPSVVVALADTGVNPYHEAFYRPQNTAHPCTWVVGFKDCSIPALNLSVGKHKDFAAAVAADRAAWAAVKPHQWYWIPKTNIIGAVCDTVVGGGPTSVLPSEVPPACILDEQSHGTATASSVLTEAPDALLLIHEGNAGGYDIATSPVTADVQSHSWGGVAYVAPTPMQVTRPFVDDPCPVGSARSETLVFLAAGNEAPTPTLLDCARARPDIQVVGGGYPGYSQANSWTLYDFASWYCRPAASNVSTHDRFQECGTSFAAPTAAGAAAAALLSIRRHDGYVGRSTTARVSTSVTRDEFVAALRTAASYQPRAKFPVPCLDPSASCFVLVRSAGMAPVPEQAPYLFWGYGWLDSTITQAVVSCALRRACPAKSPESAAYNEQRQQAKTVTGLYLLAPEKGNDARSGRDAGENASSAIVIAPRVTYQGKLAPGLDFADGYLLRATAGQKLRITSSTSPEQAGLQGCWSVFRPDGRRLTPTSTGNVFSCDPGTAPPSRLQLPTTGTYLLEYRSELPHDYQFSVGLG